MRLSGGDLLFIHLVGEQQRESEKHDNVCKAL